MSGTSFDGIDLALCSFELKNDLWDFKIEKAETIPYSDEWKRKLKEAEQHQDTYEIDHNYGEYIGKVIRNVFDSNTLRQVDLIASHGHTIFHEPDNGITVQIGSGKSIKNTTGITTISNFRQQDVHLGGQGAPLVPIGDLLIFKDYEYCVNIGGFANLSHKQNGSITAWDICPVNYVLNALTAKLGSPYDKDGRIAEGGSVNSRLLNTLNQLDYYTSPPPKSLAREWVEQNIFPLLSNSSISTEYYIATFTEHAAIQIMKNLKGNGKALFTGGGSYNSYLLERIKAHNPTIQIELPSSELIEFKEALIFAFLGVLRWRNETNTLASVTGAKYDHSAGDIYL